MSNTGGWLRVRQVRGSPRRETVYNFEVAGDHTYFVGEAGVWVHNLCEAGKARLAELKARYAARQRARARGEEVPSAHPGFSEYARLDRQIRKEAVLAEVPPSAGVVVFEELGRKLALVPGRNNEARFLAFEPRGVGSKFQGVMDGMRFVRGGRKVKVEPTGALKAEVIDLGPQVKALKAAEKVFRDLSDSKVATDLADAIEIALRKLSRKRKRK